MTATTAPTTTTIPAGFLSREVDIWENDPQDSNATIVARATAADGAQYRASIVWDEWPEMPYSDGGCPTFRVSHRGYLRGREVEHVYGTRPDGCEHVADLERALSKFCDDFGQREGIAAFTRWAGIYHSGDVATRKERDGSTYVAVATGELGRFWEMSDDWQPRADLVEVGAYIDGEVYGVRLERLAVSATTVTDPVMGDVLEDDEEECWHEEDAVWGIYGEDYATTEARDMLTSAILCHCKHNA